MKKKIIGLLSAILCCLLTACVSTQYYSYNNTTGELIVTGSETINEDDPNYMALWYIERPIIIKINSDVTTIGSHMFASQHDGMSGEPRNYYDATKKVYIADGVKHIGESAFWYNGMNTIDIPDSITTIGDNAFDNCKNLKFIRFPEKVTTIPYNACAYCTKLESVEISEGVKVIEEDAFIQCESLTEVTFPSTLEEICDGAFYNCKNLKTVTILNKNTKIAMNALGISKGDPISRKDGFTIKGFKGSTAEEYANKFAFNFVTLD